MARFPFVAAVIVSATPVQAAAHDVGLVFLQTGAVQVSGGQIHDLRQDEWVSEAEVLSRLDNATLKNFISDGRLKFRSNPTDSSLVQYGRVDVPNIPASFAEQPKTPGCYVITASGCPNRKKGPRAGVWMRDPRAGSDVTSAACEARRAKYDTWCRIADSQMLFVGRGVQDEAASRQSLVSKPSVQAEVKAESKVLPVPQAEQETLRQAEVKAEDTFLPVPQAQQKTMRQESGGLFSYVRRLVGRFAGSSASVGDAAALTVPEESPQMFETKRPASAGGALANSAEGRLQHKGAARLSDALGAAGFAEAVPVKSPEFPLKEPSGSVRDSKAKDLALGAREDEAKLARSESQPLAAGGADEEEHKEGEEADADQIQTETAVPDERALAVEEDFYLHPSSYAIPPLETMMADHTEAPEAAEDFEIRASAADDFPSFAPDMPSPGDALGSMDGFGELDAILSDAEQSYSKLQQNIGAAMGAAALGR